MRYIIDSDKKLLRFTLKMYTYFNLINALVSNAVRSNIEH